MSILAAAPALPLHTAGPYVAAAYIAFVVLLLVYVAIMARRLTRNQRDILELRRELEAREAAESLGDAAASAEIPAPGEAAQRV
jgi:HAMP domain-containing protein